MTESIRDEIQTAALEMVDVALRQHLVMDLISDKLRACNITPTDDAKLAMLEEISNVVSRVVCDCRLKGTGV